jgi:hypothetical protein
MLKNANDLDFSAAASIADKTALEKLKEPLNTDVLFDLNIVNNFLVKYRQWIESTNLNQFVGLEHYLFSCFSAGTSESFDKFYIANSSRRFRCFRGEYVYHKIAWRDHFNWAYIEDAPLDKNDAVVISLPFSDTGNQHSLHDTILAECEELAIPVLIDCCYFGTCANIKFNLNYNCITDVVFSLSKAFPVAHARIGMRLSKIDTDDTLSAYNKPGLMYTNRLTASLGLRLVEQFSPDYIYSKYNSKQLDFCQITNSVPSNTVLFGLGGDHWKHLSRGTSTNRLSFHRYLGDNI